jgi:hypothetical protein
MKLENLPTGVINHILKMLPVNNGNRARAGAVSRNFRERVNNLNRQNHAKRLHKKLNPVGLWSRYTNQRKRGFLKGFHLNPQVMNRYIAILNQINRNEFKRVYPTLSDNERKFMQEYLNKMSK